MNTQAKDLTKEAPASPAQRVGGYVILARLADKARAEFLGGNLGEYHTNCPLDGYLLGFKGVPYQDLKALILAGADDAAVAEYLDAHGTPKTPAEVEAWSDGLEAAHLSYAYQGHPEREEVFVERCRRLDLDFATTTVFGWLEADDKASF